MPLVLTPNSPSTGSIAWSEFRIQYLGVTYLVNPGNTATRFVWWRYNGGAPVLENGNALPDGTGSVPALGQDDILLFLNKSGTPLYVPTASVVDGSLIVNGSIYADALSANSVTGAKILAGTVDTTHLAAGSVKAAQIDAGAVTSEKLTIGAVSTNYVVNGSFEDGAVGWYRRAGNGAVDVVTGAAASGANSLRITRGSTTTYVEQDPKNWIPVSAIAGRSWYVACRAGASAATTNGFYLRQRWYDGSKTFISSTDVAANRPLSTSYALFEGQATPPANAQYMALEVILTNAVASGVQAFVDEIIAQEVVVSAAIADGAISTPKLQAGAVTAQTIAAGAVTSQKMIVTDVFNYIENPTIAANSNGWTSGGTWQNLTSSASGVDHYFSRATSGTSVITNDYRLPVSEGDLLNIGITAYGANNAGQEVGLSWYNAAGTLVSTDYVTLPTQSNWTEYNYSAQVPANVFYASWTFRHNGTGTARFALPTLRRRLGGELIVDGAIAANHIRANSIQGDHIQGGTITADLLDADVLQSGFVLTGTIIVGAGYWSADRGLVIPTPDGDIVLPSDGVSPAQIAGHLNAASLNVQKDLTVNGLAQINGDLRLQNGISAPRTAPNTRSGWFSMPAQAITFGEDSANVYNSLVEHSSTVYATAVSYAGAAIRLVNKSDGSLNAYPDPTNGKAWTTDFYPQGGMAKVGSTYYLMGQDAARSNGWYIYAISATTWEKTGEAYVNTQNSLSLNRTRITSDGTNVLIVYQDTNGNRALKLQRRNTSLQILSEHTLIASNSTLSDIGDALYADAGGGTRLYVQFGTHVLAFDPAASTPWTIDNNLRFLKAGGRMRGLVLNTTDGRMRSFDTTGKIWTYSKWATDTSMVASNTWYDGDTGGTGTHETNEGVTKTFNLPARSFPVVETGTPPDAGITDASRADKADRARVYLSPTAGGVRRLVATLPVGRREWGPTYNTPTELDTLNGSAATPPATNGFVGAQAVTGKISTEIGGFNLNGDGTGSWPLLIENIPLVRMAATANAATNATWRKVSLGQVPTNGIRANITTNASAVKILEAGFYMCTGTIIWAANGTGRRLALIEKTTEADVNTNLGAGEVIGRAESPVTTGGYSTLNMSGMIYCAAGDHIRLCAYQNSGASVNIDNAYLQVVRV